jgi:vancomycin permeability regulator SanA
MISGLRCRGFSISIESVAPVSAHVVVALGGGITADGEPQPATVARSRRAAALHRSGRVQQIVMSGAYAMYDPPPPRAEATAMTEIAVAAGVPQAASRPRPGRVTPSATPS